MFPFLSSLTCVYLGTPPYTTRDLMPTAAPYSLITTSTCIANSRVGDKTNMPGKRRPDTGRFLTINERAGILNASVFPLPVSAIPTISLLWCIKIDHDCAWIGEGFLKPF